MTLVFSVPILARQIPLAFNEPPLLPPPPLLHSILLESPGAWFVACVLLIAGIALLMRPKKILRTAGGGVAALAVGVGILQQVVVTQHEMLIMRSREAVMAVAKADEVKLRELLAENFKVTYKDAPQGLNKTETIAQAKSRFGGKEPDVSIGEVQAIADNERFARSVIRLTGRSDDTYGAPLMLWGMLNWEKVDGAWKLSSAELNLASPLKMK